MADLGHYLELATTFLGTLYALATLITLALPKTWKASAVAAKVGYDIKNILTTEEAVVAKLKEAGVIK